MAYSPDGKWLATGGWDRTIKLRDAATGEEKLTIFGHEGFVLDLAFSPDGGALVSTSEDRSVRLWEVPSGRRVAALHGHTDFVQAVAFRPDGPRAGDRQRGWARSRSGPHPLPARPVVFDGHSGLVGQPVRIQRDGRRIVSGGESQTAEGKVGDGLGPEDAGELDPSR